MAITKEKSKHNEVTLTEEQYYFNLRDYMSNGKCCRWTAAPTELLWIRLASVCGKYRVQYTGSPCNVCRTSGQYEIWWRSIFPVIRTVTPWTKWRYIFQPVIRFVP